MTNEKEVLRTFAAMLTEIGQLPADTPYQTRAIRAFTGDLGDLMRNWLCGEIGLGEFESLAYQNVGRHLPERMLRLQLPTIQR